MRELRLDETTTFEHVRLAWVDLNDSRCPRGAQCVWEGQVVATIVVSRDDIEPQTVELTLRPGVVPSPQTAAGYELRLLRVDPYPREGIIPDRSEYIAIVEIRAV